MTVSLTSTQNKNGRSKLMILKECVRPNVRLEGKGIREHYTINIYCQYEWVCSQLGTTSLGV